MSYSQQIQIHKKTQENVEAIKEKAVSFFLSLSRSLSLSLSFSISLHIYTEVVVSQLALGPVRSLCCAIIPPCTLTTPFRSFVSMCLWFGTVKIRDRHHESCCSLQLMSSFFLFDSPHSHTHGRAPELLWNGVAATCTIKATKYARALALCPFLWCLRRMYGEKGSRSSIEHHHPVSWVYGSVRKTKNRCCLIGQLNVRRLLGFSFHLTGQTGGRISDVICGAHSRLLSDSDCCWSDTVAGKIGTTSSARSWSRP